MNLTAMTWFMVITKNNEIKKFFLFAIKILYYVCTTFISFQLILLIKILFKSFFFFFYFSFFLFILIYKMRLEPTLKVSRLAKYIIFIYVVISLVYATHHYFSIHHSSVDYKGSLNNNFIHNDESWSRKQQILQRLENIEKQKKLDKTTTWSMKGKLTLFFI